MGSKNFTGWDSQQNGDDKDKSELPEDVEDVLKMDQC